MSEIAPGQVYRSFDGIDYVVTSVGTDVLLDDPAAETPEEVYERGVSISLEVFRTDIAEGVFEDVTDEYAGETNE